MMERLRLSSNNKNRCYLCPKKLNDELGMPFACKPESITVIIPSCNLLCADLCGKYDKNSYCTRSWDQPAMQWLKCWSCFVVDGKLLKSFPGLLFLAPDLLLVLILVLWLLKMYLAECGRMVLVKLLLVAFVCWFSSCSVDNKAFACVWPSCYPQPMMQRLRQFSSDKNRYKMAP